MGSYIDVTKQTCCGGSYSSYDSRMVDFNENVSKYIF